MIILSFGLIQAEEIYWKVDTFGASGLVVGDSGGNTPHGAAERPGTQPFNEAAASRNSLTHQPFWLARDNGIEGTGTPPAGEIPPADPPEIPKRLFI